MSKVLILHAYMNTPDTHWYKWVGEKLEEKDHEVYIPELPGGEAPTYEGWREATLDTCAIDEDTIIITHSLSTLLGLRLAEEYKFKQLILVAGWDFNSLAPYEQSFWQGPTIHDSIKENVENVTVVTSDNDPWVGSSMAKEMAERLDAEYVLVEGAGHFREKDGYKEFPGVLSLIQN